MYIVIPQGSIEGRSTWPKQAPDWNIQQTDASTRPKPAPGRSTSTRHQYKTRAQSTSMKHQYKAPCRSNLQNTRIRLKYSVKGFDLLLWLQKLYPKKLEEGLAVNISLEKWFSPPFLSIKETKLNQFCMIHTYMWLMQAYENRNSPAEPIYNHAAFY